MPELLPMDGNQEMTMSWARRQVLKFIARRTLALLKAGRVDEAEEELSGIVRVVETYEKDLELASQKTGRIQ